MIPSAMLCEVEEEKSEREKQVRGLRENRRADSSGGWKLSGANPSGWGIG